jgi:hypothetical protein
MLLKWAVNKLDVAEYSKLLFFFYVPRTKPKTTISMVLIKSAVSCRSCFESHSFTSNE